MKKSLLAIAMAMTMSTAYAEKLPNESELNTSEAGFTFLDQGELYALVCLDFIDHQVKLEIHLGSMGWRHKAITTDKSLERVCMATQEKSSIVCSAWCEAMYPSIQKFMEW